MEYKLCEVQPQEEMASVALEAIFTYLQEETDKTEPGYSQKSTEVNKRQ